MNKIGFSPFDVVVHAAGSAYQDTKADQKDLYYKINGGFYNEVSHF